MLMNWIDLFIFLFWNFFFLLFIYNHYLINLLLLNELIWIVIFIYYSVFGLYLDIFLVVFLGLGALGIATGESVIGLSLIILKNVIFSNSSQNNFLNNKNFYFYRYKKFLKKS